MTVLDENNSAHESRHPNFAWRLPSRRNRLSPLTSFPRPPTCGLSDAAVLPHPTGAGSSFCVGGSATGKDRFSIVSAIPHPSSYPAFAPRQLRRFLTTMRALTSPAFLLSTAGVSQLNAIVLPNVLPPTTRCTTVAEFHSLSCTRRAHRASTPLAAGHYSTRIWASPLARVLTNAPGRIAFVSCGPSVPFPLLSTSPRGDAVTVGYKPERFSLRRTFTSLA